MDSSALSWLCSVFDTDVSIDECKEGFFLVQLLGVIVPSALDLTPYIVSSKPPDYWHLLMETVQNNPPVAQKLNWNSALSALIVRAQQLASSPPKDDIQNEWDRILVPLINHFQNLLTKSIEPANPPPLRQSVLESQVSSVGEQTSLENIQVTHDLRNIEFKNDNFMIAFIYILRLGLNLVHPQSRVSSEISGLIRDWNVCEVETGNTMDARYAQVLMQGHLYTLLYNHFHSTKLETEKLITSLYQEPKSLGYNTSMNVSNKLDPENYHIAVMTQILTYHTTQTEEAMFPKLEKFLKSIPGYDPGIHTPYDMEDGFLIWITLANPSADLSSDLYVDIMLPNIWNHLIAQYSFSPIQIRDQGFFLPYSSRSILGKQLVMSAMIRLFESFLQYEAQSRSRLKKPRQSESQITPEASKSRVIDSAVSINDIQYRPDSGTVVIETVLEKASGGRVDRESLTPSLVCTGSDSSPATKVVVFETPNIEPFQAKSSGQNEVPSSSDNVQCDEHSHAARNSSCPQTPQVPSPCDNTRCDEHNHSAGNSSCPKTPQVPSPCIARCDEHCRHDSSLSTQNKTQMSVANYDPKCLESYSARMNSIEPSIANDDSFKLGVEIKESLLVTASHIEFPHPIHEMKEDDDIIDLLDMYNQSEKEQSRPESDTEGHTSPVAIRELVGSTAPSTRSASPLCNIREPSWERLSNYVSTLPDMRFYTANSYVSEDSRIGGNVSPMELQPHPVDEQGGNYNEKIHLQDLDGEEPMSHQSNQSNSHPVVMVFENDNYDPSSSKHLRLQSRLSTPDPRGNEKMKSNFCTTNSECTLSGMNQDQNHGNNNRHCGPGNTRAEQIKNQQQLILNERHLSNQTAFLAKDTNIIRRNVENASTSAKRRGNKKLILNALQMCLGGGVNARVRKQVIEDVERSGANQFVICLRGHQNHGFKALYTHVLEENQLVKLYGLGPLEINPKDISEYLKYESWSRSFKPIPTRSLSGLVHGIVVHEGPKTKGASM